MNKNDIKILTSIILIIGVWACKDVIEEDLSKKKVVLIAPSDNVISTVVNQTFAWESLNGVTKYQIQIVRPNFESISKLLLDTIISKNKINYSLAVGYSYQWRVRAISPNYSSEYTTRSIRIDSTDDISVQSIVLNAPANNSYLNNYTVNFNWGSLYLAQNYNVQISSSSGVLLTQFSNITTNSLNVEFENDGTYTINVLGIDSKGNKSQASSKVNIIVDKTPPITPLLSLPSSNFVSGNNTDSTILSWTSGDKIEMSKNNILIYSPDSLTEFSNVNVPYTNAYQTYTYKTTIKGSFWWKVISYDKAGNSSISDLRKFTLK